jgi:hypothetical protein
VSGLAEGLLAAKSGLKLLDLSSNQLSSTGVAALAAALGRHPAGAATAAAVQHLVLADNPAIDDDAVCNLAQSLTGVADSAAAEEQQQQQRSLKLDLAQSGVGAGGIAALSKVPGLTQLSLFGCKLGGEQGESICRTYCAHWLIVREPRHSSAVQGSWADAAQPFLAASQWGAR